MINLLKIIIILSFSFLVAKNSSRTKNLKLKDMRLFFGGGITQIRHSSDSDLSFYPPASPGSDKSNNFSNKYGFHLGFEIISNPLLLGLSIAKRGGRLPLTEQRFQNIDSVLVHYNYVDMHMIYPNKNKFFRYFSGFKFGMPLGGERISYQKSINYWDDTEEEKEEIKSENMKTDFGLLFGFLLGKHLRVTYYHGIFNIQKEETQNKNKIFNRVFELSYSFVFRSSRF